MACSADPPTGAGLPVVGDLVDSPAILSVGGSTSD